MRIDDSTRKSRRVLGDMENQKLRDRGFAGDNNSGICPEAWKMLERANHGHTPAYGFDSYTDQASAAIQEMFDTDCQVYFTFTGSAANALAVAQLCRSYEFVICHEFAHLEVGECGGPEFFSGGSKVVAVPGPHGQLDRSGIEAAAKARRGDFQFPVAKAVSFTQATELGTVYSLEKLVELSRASHDLGLWVHMDGARFANALVHLECDPADTTWRAGVDVLTLGGTKNGLAAGEALVFFNRELAAGFDYRWKQSGQVASKMRFLAAPWIGFLHDGAWLRHARHANGCASHLEASLRQLDGIVIAYPRQANSVFVQLSPELQKGLTQRGWAFVIMPDGNARFTCSWDTHDTELEALIRDFRELTTSTQLD